MGGWADVHLVDHRRIGWGRLLVFIARASLHALPLVPWRWTASGCGLWLRQPCMPALRWQWQAVAPWCPPFPRRYRSEEARPKYHRGSSAADVHTADVTRSGGNAGQFNVRHIGLDGVRGGGAAASRCLHRSPMASGLEGLDCPNGPDSTALTDRICPAGLGWTGR